MCSTLGYYSAAQHQQRHSFNQSQLYSPANANTNYSIYKSKKISPSRRLKNLLKPLLRHLFKTESSKKRNSYIASDEKEAEFDWLHNEMDNRANENLEAQLYDELYCSEQGKAIVVYDEVGALRLAEINKQNPYVPVHFERTNVGTFFWTSLQQPAVDPLKIEWNFMDRWGQA